MNDWLTREEVADLTGYKQLKKQYAWLTQNGIAFELAKFCERPLVVRPGSRRPEPRPAPFVPPPLDSKVAFQPLEDIRAQRVVYSRGYGPCESGIYFLFRRWALVYVGQSVNINARLHAHYMKRATDRHNAIWFNKVTTIEVPRYWLEKVEHHYISKYRPPFNIRLTPQRCRSATEVLI
jgi:hypothetical protein